MRIKLFADGADRLGLLVMSHDPRIQGFTTNPTLMHKAGIANYERFARDMVEAVPDRPISFEVFADEFDEMERQAKLIASWGGYVYVKIPITNTRGESSLPLISRLAQHERIKLNVTAVMTDEQIGDVCGVLGGGPPAILSVFAGRIADTGRDPVPTMISARRWINRFANNVELLWASPREVLNVYQADEIGCHIITITPDLLKKLDLAGKDLDTYSLETVQMFRRDAVTAGYVL